MAPRPRGSFEQLVLAAILAQADNAYGMTIHAAVEDLARPHLRFTRMEIGRGAR
jgi:hypothetical protein